VCVCMCVRVCVCVCVRVCVFVHTSSDKDGRQACQKTRK